MRPVDNFHGKIVPTFNLGHPRFPTLASLAAFRHGTILRELTNYFHSFIAPDSGRLLSHLSKTRRFL